MGEEAKLMDGGTRCLAVRRRVSREQKQKQRRSVMGKN